MEITQDQHFNTVLIITETQAAHHTAPPREPQVIRFTIPQHGGPWTCMIRDAAGNPVTGLYVSEDDLRELAREISENLPLQRREPRPAPGITTVDAAADYLRSACRMKVLDRNWCCDEGGLSVIAADQGKLVVVYLRLADDAGRFHRPLTELTAGTVQLMHRLAAIWARQQPGMKFASPAIRIDVLGLARNPQGGGYSILHERDVHAEAEPSIAHLRDM
jgi:Holliday junction resolvase-like predicted endonuclease